MRSFIASVLTAASLVALLPACANPPVESKTATPSVAAVQYAPGTLTAYLVGHVAAGSGDYALAGQAFNAVLSADPHNGHALAEGFEVALLSGSKDTVALARQLSGNPLAQLVLANDLAARGQWDQAEAAYANLPSAGPFQVMKPVLAAWCEAGAGSTIAAVGHLQSAAQGSPLAWLYQYNAAAVADAAGRFEDAETLYRNALSQLSQPSLRVAWGEASFLNRAGQVNTAQGMLTDLLQDVPQDRMALPRILASLNTPLVSNARQGLAEFYYAVGGELQSASQANPQTAELSRAFLQMAINLRPDLTIARLAAASEDTQAHRVALARDVLAPVKADDPLDPLVRIERAGIIDGLGQTDQALQLLTQVAADYPKFPEPLQVMGDIQRQHDRSQEAVASYTQAVQRRGQLSGGDWLLLYDRASVEQNMGNWPAAESDLQSALRLAPNQPALLNFLGYSWADQNRNLSQARDLIERAVKLSPGDGAILDSLGWVKFRQGDVKDAVATLENAVRLVPEDPDVNTHLGDAYAAAGRQLEARYQWQFALTLNPSSDAAAKLRAKLTGLQKPGDGRQATSKN